jgi:hypothetical protein
MIGRRDRFIRSARKPPRIDSQWRFFILGAYRYFHEDREQEQIREESNREMDD